ncbi:MAG: nitroreductase family protein [Candidatus Hydrothermarchaeota archaeon]
MDEPTDEVRRARRPGYKIHPIILGRWSPRAMTGEGLSDDELMPLFEAARWAPSSYNGQPWRFIYARRDTKHWDRLYDLLAEGNKLWARKAAVLAVVVSRKRFEHNEKPARTHSFDAGAAWENLALEGTRRGLVIHGMQGFDYDKARDVLGIPEAFEVEAMIAIGKRGKKEDLPKDLREIEFPSERKPISAVVFEGRFPT